MHKHINAAEGKIGRDRQTEVELESELETLNKMAWPLKFKNA